MIVLVFLVAAAVKLEAVKITCEKIERCNSVAKCCYLDETTVINVTKVTMDDRKMGDVHGIFFDENKNIQFLPVNIYNKFPNLRLYSASTANIKEVSALNFKKLSILKVLDLEGNQIKFIPDDCFQGLLRLHEINLSK